MMSRLLWLFLLCPLIFFSQGHLSKWYFGNKCALDFSNGNPVNINNSAMMAAEGCASIADSAGNLLFYSNGMNVWNKNHQYMANGIGLGGHPSSTQSAFIAKKPGSVGIYYLFTVGEGGNGTLAYSIVDMSLAAGMGSVTIKSAALSGNMTEKLCGTMHCNGKDVWILGHKYLSDEFHSFLLSATGVNTVPVVSAVGSVHAPVNSWETFSGEMKISPGGKKIGAVMVRFGVELLDFDVSNGQVANALFLDSLWAYGCEFSPDGTKFYASGFGQPADTPRVHQWDLCAGSGSAIAASQVKLPGLQKTYLGWPVSLGSLQLATDQKIYIAHYQDSTISRIDNPNIAGLACSFTPSALTVSTGTSLFGLPNFINSGFRAKGFINATLSCGVASFSYTPPAFCAMANYSVSSQKWVFGDSGSGQADTSFLAAPSHSYAKNGVYPVKLVTYYPCYTDTVTQLITINALPNLTVAGNTSMCVNSSSTFTASGADTYSWSTGQKTNTLSVNPVVTTTYTVTGSYNNSCKSTQTITLNVEPCTGLRRETIAPSKLWIYPNPGTGIFTVETSENLKLSIYNVMGTEVFEATVLSPAGLIDLSMLPKGVYFVAEKEFCAGRQLIIKQ